MKLPIHTHLEFIVSRKIFLETPSLHYGQPIGPIKVITNGSRKQNLMTEINNLKQTE